MKSVIQRIACVVVLCCAGICFGAGSVSPHPNIIWTAKKAFDSYNVEIATDTDFKNVVDRDTIDNIARYVPEKPLAPGTYYWKAGEQHGSFEVEAPNQEILIPSGSGMTEIRAALAAAKTNASTCIRFEPGEYQLHPGFEGTVFEIIGITNLVVDGGGAKLVIHDIARLAEVRFSKHITFRNFTVDYDVPLYTAAKVESVAADGAMELSLWPGCIPPESMERFMEEKRGLFYDPEYPRMAENVFLLVYMKDAWEPLGGGRYRLRAVKPKEVQPVKPGMVYICAPRYKPQGIELYNSDDITFADVTTYYLPGIGVVTAFVEDLKLIRFKILRRQDRLLGAQNGGTNIHNARIGPWIEGCRFENTGDDNNHISSLIITPVQQPQADVVVVSSQQPGTRGLPPDMDILPGDTLAFFNQPAGTLLAEATVLSAVITGRQTRVVLDRNIPEIICGSGRDNPELKTTQVYNLSRSCGNFAFRNNEFVRGRRTGILVKSGPGLIENNRFEELGGGGVEIFNAPFEGLYGHDILIQSNLFRRGGLVYKNSGPAPAVWVEIFHGEPSQILHRNIRIVGNRIVDCSGNGIEVSDSTGVRIENNQFENKELSVLRDPAAFMIKLVNTANCAVEGNQFSDSRFKKSQQIRKDSE
jgi:parallel beta-helix repeat protein